MTTPIIIAAAKSSDTISDLWHEAFKALEYGGHTNGYGILYDPSASIRRLEAAKKAIDTAVATYRAAHWPTDAEYIQAEEVASETQRQRRQRRLEDEDTVF